VTWAKVAVEGEVDVELGGGAAAAASRAACKAKHERTTWLKTGTQSSFRKKAVADAGDAAAPPDAVFALDDADER
jgi:hypothetical protein